MDEHPVALAIMQPVTEELGQELEVGGLAAAGLQAPENSNRGCEELGVS